MPRTIDAVATLAEIKRKRKIARRNAGLHSKLNRYRSSLVGLRRAGASYRDLVFWLRINHRMSTDHTTVMRWMKNLPELTKDSSGFSTTSTVIQECENEKKLSIPGKTS